MRPEDYIAGLLAELDNETRAGRSERLGSIRAELARMGVKPPTAERAVNRAPRETRKG